MVNPKLLYGLIAALGTVFMAAFLLIPMFFPMTIGYTSSLAYIGSVIQQLIWFSSSIIGVVFITAGLCGIYSQYLKNQQTPSAQQAKLSENSRKHSTMFKTIAVLGTAFLATFFAVMLVGKYSVEVTGFFMSTYPFASLLIFAVLIGGTSLLTVGVCGMVRQHLRNHQNFFTILAAILIPSLILMPLFYYWMSPVTVSF